MVVTEYDNITYGIECLKEYNCRTNLQHLHGKDKTNVYHLVWRTYSRFEKCKYLEACKRSQGVQAGFNKCRDKALSFSIHFPLLLDVPLFVQTLFLYFTVFKGIFEYKKAKFVDTKLNKKQNY